MKFIRFEMAGKAEIGILNKEETGILPLSRIYPGIWSYHYAAGDRGRGGKRKQPALGCV